MDKAQAIHAFWAGFAWPAIDEQSAYDTATMDDLDIGDRYITYEVMTGNLGNPLSMTASLWLRSTSWEDITKKADEIAAYIGYGGRVLPVAGGKIWIKLGQPFAQRMAAEADYDWRRIVLTIEVDFLTAT